jgi:hypothetical protein
VRKTRTGWFGLSVRRSRHYAAMLAVLGLTILLASFVVSAVTAYLSLSATREATTAIVEAGEDGHRFTLVIPIATDAAAQRAAGERLVTSLVDTRALKLTIEQTQNDGDALLTFDLRPDPQYFTATAIPGLVDGLTQMQRALTTDPDAAPHGVSAEGTLPTELARVQAQLSVEQAATGIPIALAAIIALVALIQGARLLVESQRDEFLLSRARGASMSRIAFTVAVMALSVGAPAAAISVAGAAALLAGWFGSAVALMPVLPAVGVVVVSTMAVVTETVRVTASASQRSRDRGGFVASIATLVIIFVVSGLALSQFLLRRTPLQVSASGVPYVDPLIAAAPALALLTVVVLGLAAFSPAARAVEAISARSRGSAVIYPARYLARRTALHIASATVVALAVGSFIVAGAFASTVQHLAEGRQQLIAGSDVRVLGVSPSVHLTPDAERTSSRVLVTGATVGSDSMELVAIPHDAIGTVMTTAGGLVETRAIADALPGVAAGVDVPDGVALDIVGAQNLDELTAVGTFIYPNDGTVTQVALPAAVDDRLRLIRITVRFACPLDTCDVTVESTTPGAKTLTPQSPLYGPIGSPTTVARGISEFTYDAPGLPDSIPLVVTRDLASRLALAVGDDVTVQAGTGGRQFTATVARIVDLIPGTTNPLASIAELGSVALATRLQSGSTLEPNELWFRSDDVAASIASISGLRVMTASDVAGSATASTALWLGAIGAAALAVAALAAGAALSARTRRAEPGLLRALGMSVRQAGRVVTLEQWLVTVIAVALGIVSGVVVSALTVPDLAHASLAGASDALPAPLVIEFTPVALAVAASTAAFLTVGIVAGWRAGRAPAVREGQ